MEVSMHTTFMLSSDSRMTAGILLLAIVTIEYGGWFMLRVVQGRQPVTAFQQAFFRAGHAHAGVLVILSLVTLILADAAQMSGVLAFLARNGIWVAAILMPAGFFLSATGKGVTVPNRFIVLLYVGIGLLALGVLSLGIGLLTT
jgi:hypothetical protein